MLPDSRRIRALAQAKYPPNSPRASTLEASHNGVLFLEQSHVKFEPPTQNVSVFFDECNREIISLTIGLDSKTRVLFQSTNFQQTIPLLLPIEKKILSIKLNSLRTVLAYHVERSTIEFINVRLSEDCDDSPVYVLDDRRYVQASRAKNSKLLGFLWTGPLELIMITDISIEYYHVDPQKRRLRLLKSFQSATNWFVYQPAVTRISSESTEDKSELYSILMVSTGSIGNSMQPYMLYRDQIIKLQRFDVEGNWHGSDKLELFERSITVASLYDCVRLLVLQHESLNVKSKGAQILIYTVDHQSGVTAKTHTLDLDVSGRFAINIFDNLVIAHDQPSKTSFIFDIMIESTEKSDCPKHFVSLIDNKPIRPMKLRETGDDLVMYSLNWVFFQPNFIIDAKIGLLSALHLDLVALESFIKDDLVFLDFLAYRKDSEKMILGKCKQMIANLHDATLSPTQSQGNPLAEVSATLDILSNLVASAPELSNRASLDKQMSEKVFISHSNEGKHKYNAILLQEDVHREIFQPLDSMINDNPTLAQLHFITSTLFEFIFTVRKLGKRVDFCIYEHLLKYLVKGKRYYQMIQMIRSEILTDSKQLACQLLSLKDQYKPALQLGLDMLNRLEVNINHDL